MIIIASVYIHTIKKNGKKYIGQCNGDPKERWGSSGHRYKGQLFYKAIQKYGWQNIDHKIVATDLTQQEADELERKLIKEYNTTNRNFGYNIEEGGKDTSKTFETSYNARQVCCIETGQTWISSIKCAKEIGINLASLQESLYNGYRCKGYHYKYVDDNNYTEKNPHSVICVETGKIWKTVQECAAELGVTPRTVWRYCSRKRKCPVGKTYKYVA